MVVFLGIKHFEGKSSILCKNCVYFRVFKSPFNNQTNEGIKKKKVFYPLREHCDIVHDAWQCLRIEAQRRNVVPSIMMLSTSCHFWKHQSMLQTLILMLKASRRCWLHKCFFFSIWGEDILVPALTPILSSLSLFFALRFISPL